MFIYYVAQIKHMDSYVAGMLYGDGTQFKGKNRAYAVWVDQHVRNNDIAEFFANKLRNLKFNVHAYGFTFGPTNMKRVLVYSKDLFQEFAKLKKDSVKFFKKLDDREKSEFIGGFFDAEGTVTDRLVVYNQDLLLLKAIKKFLQLKGIKSYIYRFGKIHGVQIYRKSDISKFRKLVSCIKLSRSASSG